MSYEASPYDDFAADYHWILSDEQVSGEHFLRQYAGVLERLPAGAAVLDCACGPGFDTMALARCGFSVVATDASAAMVDVARRAVSDAGLDVEFSCCRWEELPQALTGGFDAVFCVGNSISHCDGAEAMLASLAGIRAVLRAGGQLVVEARDWEALRAEGARFEVRDVAVRAGGRGVCVYVWTIPEQWDEPHRAEVLVVVEQDGSLRHRSVELSFVPFSREDLVERLTTVGLEIVDVSEARHGRYVVNARRSRHH